MSLYRIYTYTLGGVFVIAAASSLVWLEKRKKKTVDQREALRRQRLSARGRITDGTVLDVQEVDSGNGHLLQLVMYAYGVAGVQYECSQDVTPVHRFVDPHSCPVGVTVSIKYDPFHPGNSIVIAEDWCGLRI